MVCWTSLNSLKGFSWAHFTIWTLFARKLLCQILVCSPWTFVRSSSFRTAELSCNTISGQYCTTRFLDTVLARWASLWSDMGGSKEWEIANIAERAINARSLSDCSNSWHVGSCSASCKDVNTNSWSGCCIAEEPTRTKIICCSETLKVCLSTSYIEFINIHVLIVSTWLTNIPTWAFESCCVSCRLSVLCTVRVLLARSTCSIWCSSVLSIETHSWINNSSWIAIMTS